MIDTQSFKPNMRTPTQIDSSVIAVTGASQPIAVKPGQILRITNIDPTNTAAINFGYNSAVAILASDLLIPVSSVTHIQVPTEANIMGIIGSGSFNIKMVAGN